MCIRPPVKNLHSKLLATLSCVSLMVPMLSYAATIFPTPSPNPRISAVDLPGSVDPTLTNRLMPLPQTRAGVAAVSVPGFTPQAPSVAATRTSFVLKRLIVTGATVYGNTQIANIFRNYLGSRVTLADLQQMADIITVKYRTDGYVLTKAIVPAQNISDGTATIRVVEGYVNHVTIQGHPGGAYALLESYGERIEQGRPLNMATLERYALLANDIPGVNVRLVLNAAQMPNDVLAPSEITPGAADLTFVVDQHTLQGYVTFDNRGTRFLGPNEYTFGANINSLFRSGDMTGAQALITADGSELRYIRLYHQTPLGTDGIVLNVSGSASRSNPQFTLRPLDVIGHSDTLAAVVTYPMIRSRNQSLFFNLDIDSSDSRTDSLGTNLYSDRLRSFRFSGSYNIADSWLGINQIGAQASQGITGLGATKNDDEGTSRPNADSDYTKFTATASRLQNLTHNFSVLAAAQGQWAVDPLLTVELFTFGGSQFGTAYDPAAITGDRGAAGKVELRYDIYPGYRALQNLQFFAVYDIGKIWNIEPIGQPAQLSAASAGLGVRTSFTSFLAGSLEIAKPLTLKVATANNKAPRVFFSLTLSGDTPACCVPAIPLPPPVPAGTGLTPVPPQYSYNTAYATRYRTSAAANNNANFADANTSATTASTSLASSTPPMPHYEGLTPIGNNAVQQPIATNTYSQNTYSQTNNVNTQTSNMDNSNRPMHRTRTFYSANNNPQISASPNNTQQNINTVNNAQQSYPSSNTATIAQQNTTNISQQNFAPTNNIQQTTTTTVMQSTSTSASASGNYVLQLRSGRDLNDLHRFAAMHHLTDEVHYIHTQYQGGDWYILAYGQYDTSNAAEMAGKQLPLELQHLHPWVREIG